MNAKDNNGNTALLLAIHHGYDRLVHMLLEHSRVDINAKDLKGRSAFFWANYTYHDILDMLPSFLKHEEVDVNATGANGNTPLIWACLRGNLYMVSELLKFPLTDVHAKNKAGSTALDIARKL